MIYFFYGDEEFNISNEIKKFKNKLDKNFLEMSYKYYNNPKFPDLVAVLKTQPMMFGKMLIEINCLSYLSGKSTDDKGFDDKQIAQITEALENCSEDLDIIFTAQLPPDSQKKIDKRKKFFKLLSHIVHTVRRGYAMIITAQPSLYSPHNNKEAESAARFRAGAFCCLPIIVPPLSS